MRNAVLIAAVVLLIPALLLLAEAARLPSAASLDPFVPPQPQTVPAQACREFPARVLPTGDLLPLEPAPSAADGPEPRYAGAIAHGLLCATPQRGMLRYHLDELLLTLKIRTRFSRQQQFTIYLNRVYCGGEIPGVAASAQRLFDHPANQLTLAQRALLMGLIRSPRQYDPRANPPRALARRNQVLTACCVTATSPQLKPTPQETLLSITSSTTPANHRNAPESQGQQTDESEPSSRELILRAPPFLYPSMSSVLSLQGARRETQMRK